MMSAEMWSIVAAGASWSAAKAHVLRDVHWIGGNPKVDEVYGYAGYDPATQRGMVAIRNPKTRAATFTVIPCLHLEIPADQHAAWSCEATLAWGKENPEHLGKDAGNAGGGGGSVPSLPAVQFSLATQQERQHCSGWSFQLPPHQLLVYDVSCKPA